MNIVNLHVQALEKSKEHSSKQSPTMFEFDINNITENMTKNLMEVKLSDKSTQTEYCGVQDKECQTSIIHKLSCACQTTQQVDPTQYSNVSTQEDPLPDTEHKKIPSSHSEPLSDAQVCMIKYS